MLYDCFGVFGLCLLFLKLTVFVCFHGFFLFGKFFCLVVISLVWLVYHPSLVLSFVCLFLFLIFFSLLSVMHGLWALGSPARSQAWASVVRVISPRQWTTREFLAPGNINWCEFSQSFPS